DYFNIQGSSDPLLFGAVSANNSPNTSGWILELDYIPFNYGGPSFWPWLNVKFGLQYVHFNKYAGSATNYDGLGTNASAGQQHAVRGRVVRLLMRPKGSKTPVRHLRRSPPAALLLAALGLAACGAPAQAPQTTGAPPPDVAGTVHVCSSCHGPGGHSISSTFPRLAGQQKVYLIA